MADELMKLEELWQSGALSDAEFEAAKRRLLNPEAEDRSLGRAANRYVSFQIIAGAIGLILFLIFLFTVFLPLTHRTPTPTLPTVPSVNVVPTGLFPNDGTH